MYRNTDYTDHTNTYILLLGFTGDRCEVNIDDCPYNLCQNGGKCVDGVGSYSCDCPAEYTGQYCRLVGNDRLGDCNITYLSGTTSRN